MPSRSALADCRHIELEGTFTHFASAEDFKARQTDDQEQVFLACLPDRLRALGVSPGIVHMANSGAICARPSTYSDMVRPGAILYGYYQSFDPPQKGTEVKRRLPIEPELFLMRARIITLRGSSARGRAWVIRHASSRKEAHAYRCSDQRRLRRRHLALANQSWLRAGTRAARAALVGTISMDLSTLDVTGDVFPGVALGDVVTIYGKDGKDSIVVSDVAAEIGTGDFGLALRARPPRPALLPVEPTLQLAFVRARLQPCRKA